MAADPYTDSMNRARRRLRVTGVVQGVGFRPFVYSLALDLHLAGLVGNDSAGVLIEVEGPPSALDAFQTRLTTDAPPLAFIETVTAEPCAPTGSADFVIVESQAAAAQRTFISPDVAICDDCLRELFDPTDRRYRYPFINCTNCGPRFTIIQQLPYDRPSTTMADFVMCPACRHEYENPRDRRFHAQPIACPVCGPRVEFVENGDWSLVIGHWSLAELLGGSPKPVIGESALVVAQALLVAGGIVAVKGLGGFHLACDATNEGAVQTLRERKGRVDKPFAVMVADVAMARQIAHIDDEELALLTGRERPIVLLRQRVDSPLSSLVAPGNDLIGLMLPYTPLHHLLFHPTPSSDQPISNLQSPISNLQSLPPLVMTSANYSNEPMVTDNTVALTKLATLADGFLLHNRAIHVPCDDSVIRGYAGHELPVRRSRGYAPFPVKLPVAVRPTLAVGGELKNTFCLGAGTAAFMSQHIGDMETLETLAVFEESVAHFQRIFEIQPELIVCDRHPGYLSSRWARETVGNARLVEVQHHHAHLAALMAEHGLDGRTPIIGFCFDGTGYGDDGAIWGGEVLMADYASFERRSHLTYIPLPGGDAAVKHPCRTALAHLWAARVAWEEALPPVAALTPVERTVLRQQFLRGFQTVPTSSMGRLFDAVAALAGVRQHVTYEAQGAIELEALAMNTTDTTGQYTFAIAEDGRTFDAASVIAAVVHDVLAGVPAAQIGRRFHNAVAELIVKLSLLLRAEGHTGPVALSGGVFQNVLLLQQTVTRLDRAGFRVLTHRLVPPNDGGLALGQLLVANAQCDRYPVDRPVTL
jgi:hydrogenase maturation protein HypF